MGITRLANWIEEFKVRVYSNWYARQFTKLGQNLIVTGPCFLHNEGEMRFGNNCRIRTFGFRRVELMAHRNAQLIFGNNVFINQGSRIVSRQKIVIGDECIIGDEVVVLDSDYHSVMPNGQDTAPILIGNRVWLATRAMVLKGVNIGDGSIVAAGAVVTQSVPANVMVAGVPARIVRHLSE